MCVGCFVDVCEAGAWRELGEVGVIGGERGLVVALTSDVCGPLWGGVYGGRGGEGGGTHGRRKSVLVWVLVLGVGWRVAPCVGATGVWLWPLQYQHRTDQIPISLVRKYQIVTYVIRFDLQCLSYI